jgi:hypothetical protein
MPPDPILAVLCALGVVLYGLIGCALGVGAVAYHWRKLNRDEALLGLRKWQNEKIAFRPPSTQYPNTTTHSYPLSFFSWPAFGWPVCFVIAVLAGLGLGAIFAIVGVCYGPFWLLRASMRYMTSALMSDEKREAIHAA